MLASLILCSVAMATVNTRAAVAPRSPENLAKKATHIVSGKVVKVSSQTQKSKIERAIGIHRDRIFTIKLMVTRVSKGAGVKAGDLIEIVAWQPSCRIPPLPGLQGHGSIPKKGETVQVHLVGEEGKPLEPVHPNGIAIEEAAD
jgi:hypothetical protein